MQAKSEPGPISEKAREFVDAISDNSAHLGVNAARRPRVVAEGPMANGQTDSAAVFARCLLGGSIASVAEPLWQENRGAAVLDFCRDISTVSEGEWREADHPRGGNPQNRGQFSLAGGSAPSGEHERVLTSIRLRGGSKWSGNGALDVLSTLAPKWIPFVKQHVTLALTSHNATTPTTTVRAGENGRPINDQPGIPFDKRGAMTIHLDIPSKWNDVEVAKYLLKQLADDDDAHRLAARWASADSELFKELKDERFRNGLVTIETLAKSYYLALAGATVGGQAAVALWDISQGDKLGAALDVVCLLPLGKIAQAGLESAGGITIRVGERAAAFVPTSALNYVKKLTPEKKALLSKRLLAAKTEQEAAEIFESFLKIPFDEHHPLPKFLGGDVEQIFHLLPKGTHDEFHSLLAAELKNSGLKLPIGGKTGSTKAWMTFFKNNPGTQGKALDAVLKSSRDIDAKHGTTVTQWVWKNLMGNKITFIP